MTDTAAANAVTGPEQATMKAALQAYVDRINAGDAAGVVALFAPGATIEDPVGSPKKSGTEIVRWFEDTIAFDTRITPVAPIRGSHSNEAALMFEVEFTPPAGQRLRIRSLDVCSFDQSGLITNLRAYWGPDDIAPSAGTSPDLEEQS